MRFLNILIVLTRAGESGYENNLNFKIGVSGSTNYVIQLIFIYDILITTNEIQNK